jgi:glycosyltransferase involved in cell wall biosynthesis
LEERAARLAKLIIANSHAGASDLAQRTHAGDRVQVVSNGIDTERFRPDRETGRRVRAEWHVEPRALLVGTVARLELEKGIGLFLDAAALLAKHDDRIRLPVIGRGDAAHRVELIEMAKRLGIESRVLWIGVRDDMPEIYNSLDLLVLSSPNEGTSNVILEAMACGTSVVATDVGDNKRSIGPWGLTVPVGDPAKLAEAIRAQLNRRAADPQALAEGCRNHIVENYSLAAMVETTESLLQMLIARR